MKGSRILKAAGLLAGAAALGCGAVWFADGVRESRFLSYSCIRLNCPDLPPAFNGFKIAVLADLHGNAIPELETRLAEAGVDLIACCGDIFDGVQNAEKTEAFLMCLQTIAPVAFVSGNHEYYAGNWLERSRALRKKGIHVLDNACMRMERKGQKLEICGLADPDLQASWSFERRALQLEKDLAVLPARQSFRILLFHRADLYDYTESAGADLTLSGHLHGGHWRLFGHGLLAPNNGSGIHLFPRYDAGLYEKDGRFLYVSRGLGDQMSIPRLFNPPELAILTLYTDRE